MRLSIFSYICWAFVCILWRNLYSDSLFIIELFLLNFRSSLYILDFNLLPDTWLQIFSVILWNAFLLRWECPTMYRFFNFGGLIYLIFFLCCLCFLSVISKKSLSNPVSWRFAPVFSPKSFIVLTLVLGLWLILCSFLYMVWSQDPALLFAMWKSSWKNCFLPIGWSWQPCWKSADYRCLSLFMDSQFCSIDLYSLWLLNDYWPPLPMTQPAGPQ